MKERQIGDAAYLKEPFRGYRHVEIVGCEGARYVVQVSSGYEFTVYGDELED